MTSASDGSAEPLPNISTSLQPNKAIIDADSDPAGPVSPRSPTYSPCQSTVVELVSISATSSAFPESFGLSVSSKGRCIVAYSSAALYIILSCDLPAWQHSCRAFRLRRRPLAVAVTDIGKYAVLSSSYKIDVYECGDGSKESLSEVNKKLQTISLNNEARTIAFSANGELVVAGSENGIEIVGLELPEGSNRRQINCGSVDLIAFTEDGKSLLATAPARRSRTSTFMTISGGFDQGMLMDEEEEEEEQQPIGKLWISQLLFPERLSARQSAFLPDPGNSQAGELLAFDPKSDRFGIFDTALKTFSGKILGLPEELAWSHGDRFEDTLPAVSPNGSYVAIALRLKDSSEIWTYRISSHWRDDDSPTSMNGSGRSSSLTPLQRLPLPSRPDNIAPENITCLRWVQLPDAPVERLLGLMNTVSLSMPEDVEPMAAPAASGKILIFDFKSPVDSLSHPSRNVLVDLDQFPLTDELAEEEVELEREVDLVRRRTQVQRSNRRDANPVSGPRIRRSVSSSSRNSPLSPVQDSDLHSSRLRRRRSFSSISDVGEDGELSPGVAVDEPYSQSAPRPQFMLTRAATVAQNAPAARMHLRALPSRPLEYRRADGLREMPHESDADDWVPPPPPYSERPDAPGPNAVSLPISTIPGMAERVLQGAHVQNNQYPNPRGMRSRVSQVISSVQVPILPPQSSRSSRLSQIAHATVVQRTSASQNAPPVSAQPPRSQASRIARRPVASNSQASASRTPTSSGLPAAQTVSIPPSTLPPPIPGSLNSPFTFPLGHRPRGVSNSHLHIPQTSQPHSVSAPVTPVTNSNISPAQLNRLSQQYIAQQPTTSATIPTTVSHPLQDPPHSSPSQSERLPPPNAPFANASTRRVSSLDYMRSLPSGPAENPSLIRHSSDLSTERSHRMSYSSSRAPSRLSNSQQLVLPSSNAEPSTPISRRQRWRVGSTPTRPQHPLNSTTASGYRANSHLGHREGDKGSKCVVQ